MKRYLIVSLSSGILFGLLDGLMNANPWAQQLFEVYKPIARTAINPMVGVLIDLAYGFIMAALYLLLRPSLPGKTGIAKGVAYAVIVWFFRVAMYAGSQWVMFNVTAESMLYVLAAGLAEMLILGVFYGLTLKQAS
jgi:hypothetical protein